jgi:hypothetical protein
VSLKSLGDQFIPATMQQKVSAKYCIAAKQEPIAKLLADWLVYNFEDVVKVLRGRIPAQYRKVPSTIFRGERFDWVLEEGFEKSGYAKVQGISWSTSPETAKQVGCGNKNNDSPYTVIWKYKPQPDEVLINVDAYYKSHKEEMDFYLGHLYAEYPDEQEIILTDVVTVTDRDIEAIVRSKPNTSVVSLPERFRKFFKETR